jgi:hypothetical protein
MSNIINKTKRSRVVLKSAFKEIKKIISGEDIRKGAYEIFKENDPGLWAL